MYNSYDEKREERRDETKPEIFHIPSDLQR